MRNAAIALIAMMLVGCAAVAERKPAEQLMPVTGHNLLQLQNLLRDQPPELRQAISAEASSRLIGDHVVPAPEKDAAELNGVLLDLLLTTDNVKLLPDAEFENMGRVVSGDTDRQRHKRSYAMALMRYLTQPAFSCREPFFAEYFKKRYAVAAAPAQCNEEVPFSVAYRYDGVQAVWLDPKRVKSIHLLFASKNNNIGSQFGHVALRLVVCPEGTVSGADCDSNLFDHLVLGFRAHIDELSLDTLKALKGDYKAYLFANRFMDVYEDYAIGEFREIYSLPLRLTDAGRELLVRQLSDIHWRYGGNYNFFTRNCATMLQDALRSAWPDFAVNETTAGNYLRPDNFFAALKSSSLAEGDKISLLDVAEREGHYFSSTKSFYESALNEVKLAMAAPEFTDIDSYLQIPPNKRQQQRDADKQFSARLLTDKHLREAQMMLEEYAIIRSERLLMIEGAKYLEQQDFLSRGSSISAQLDAGHAKILEECLIMPIRQHYSPLRRTNGIPDRSDIPVFTRTNANCKSEQSKKLLHEAIKGIKDAESEQWLLLERIAQYLSDSIAGLNQLKQMKDHALSVDQRGSYEQH